MSPTAIDDHALYEADQAHRHDATHHARHVAHTLRGALPFRLPPAFAPAAIEHLPEPAQRWLTHAIEPGMLLFDAIELQMQGEIKLGRWHRFSATEALVPAAGFIWAARTRIAGLRVRGFDSYALGEGETRWRLPGGIPLLSGSGYDTTRSAADRLAAEAVLLPTALVSATWRRGEDAHSARYCHHFGGRVARGHATITVAPDGRLRTVSMRRWGNPFGTGYGEHLFEVSFAGEYAMDGLVIPDRLSAAWVDNFGRRREFFRASIDTADLLLAGGPS